MNGLVFWLRNILNVKIFSLLPFFHNPNHSCNIRFHFFGMQKTPRKKRCLHRTDGLQVQNDLNKWMAADQYLLADLKLADSRQTIAVAIGCSKLILLRKEAATVNHSRLSASVCFCESHFNDKCIQAMAYTYQNLNCVFCVAALLSFLVTLVSTSKLCVRLPAFSKYTTIKCKETRLISF